MDSFFTHSIWYIALAAVGAIMLIVIFIKAPQPRKTFAFWFAVLGFTYCLEVSLLLLLGAYTYYPMIVPDDPFFDAVLGNIFSQVSVSSSAVLICVLGLSVWWLAGFSVGYFLIDVLFVSLGIYEHYWYRSIFSLAGFFIYGLITKYWYKRIFSGTSQKWIDYPTLFLSVFAVSANLIGTLVKALDLRTFQSAFYSDSSRNHTATALIYTPVMIMIMMALLKWQSPWWQKTIIFVLLLICQWGLIESGVMAVKPGWEIAVMLFDLAVFYFSTVLINKCLRSGTNPQLPCV